MDKNKLLPRSMSTQPVELIRNAPRAHLQLSHKSFLFIMNITYKFSFVFLLTFSGKFLLSTGPPKMNSNECPIMIKFMERNFIPQMHSKFSSFGFVCRNLPVVCTIEKHLISSLERLEFCARRESTLYATARFLCRKYQTWSPVASAMRIKKQPTIELK